MAILCWLYMINEFIIVSVWPITGSKPADMNRFSNHTVKWKHYLGILKMRAQTQLGTT